jgi:transposase
VERAEAEVIYDQGREVVVVVLLRMDEQIRRLEERVARQDERIAELERKLNRSSRNSSAPPSSDPPSACTRSKDPSGRKRGAQDGHEGHGRPLLPAWAVDEVIEHRPARCRCGHVFAGDERPVGGPARHQVEELPPINVKVIEHRRLRLRCPGCGRRTRAKLPEEVARSCFGPRLEAAVAALSVRNRVSRVMMRSSSAKSCSVPGSARARSTRSSAARQPRWLIRTRICWAGCAAPRR